MNPRTTVVMALVAAALGAFVYFYEIGGEADRKAAKESATSLFPGIGADDISVIQLTTSDDIEARAERRDGRWRLVEPVDFPGDDIALDGMASTLAQLTSEAEIPAGQPLSEYGLGDDARVIRFESSDASHGLRVGNGTPVGSNSYVAALDSDDVYTVPTWRVNSLNRTLDKLRDARVLRFDRSAVDRIEANWPGGGVLLVKEESGWRLIRPVEARADEATVEGLLSDLSFLRADGFVDDPPGPADTGLSSPAFEVVLTGSPPAEGADPVRVGFQLGSTVEDNVRLAKGSHEALYKVPEGRLSDFPRELVAYRFKELSNFVPADASRFVLSFESAAEGALDQAKSEVRGERGDGGWTTSPESMAPYKARELLSELANLKAVEIVAEEMTTEELADAGLAPPRVTIQVWGEGDEPLATVELGDAEFGAGILARTPASSTVYRISYDLAEQIPVSRAAFLNRFVSEDVPEDLPVIQVDDLDDLSADFSEDTGRVD